MTMPWCSLVTLVLLHTVVRSGSLQASDKGCTGEGHAVQVPGITDDPCIACHCKGGRVECEMNVCPQLEGCRAVIHDQSAHDCCGVCKGCSVNGTVYPSGAQWTHSDDPCLRLICQAGVLTVSREKCLVDCSSPVRIPGQCCPSCSDCKSNGTQHLNVPSSAHDDTSGVQCSCSAGQVTCAYYACPVLNCPDTAVYKQAGDRCPQCKGARRAFSRHSVCFFSNSIILHGAVIQPDKCTSCTCWHGTVQCQREVCPPPPCDVSEYIYRRDSCCRACNERRPCEHNNKTYQSGSQWLSGACTYCRCEDGLRFCGRQSCQTRQECPQGHSLKEFSDSCCPKCVKDFPMEEGRQLQMQDQKQQQSGSQKQQQSGSQKQQQSGSQKQQQSGSQKQQQSGSQKQKSRNNQVNKSRKMNKKNSKKKNRAKMAFLTLKSRARYLPS